MTFAQLQPAYQQSLHNLHRWPETSNTITLKSAIITNKQHINMLSFLPLTLLVVVSAMYGHVNAGGGGGEKAGSVQYAGVNIAGFDFGCETDVRSPSLSSHHHRAHTLLYESLSSTTPILLQLKCPHSILGFSYQLLLSYLLTYSPPYLLPFHSPLLTHPPALLTHPPRAPAQPPKSPPLSPVSPTAVATA